MHVLIVGVSLACVPTPSACPFASVSESKSVASVKKISRKIKWAVLFTALDSHISQSEMRADREQEAHAWRASSMDLRPNKRLKRQYTPANAWANA